MSVDLNEIKRKAEYCLNCKAKPCTKGCPLGNDIPLFIEQVKEGQYKKAYETLCKTTVLPSICGRICPHMSQCMGRCVRGVKGEPVDIGYLEAFVGDIAIKEGGSLPNRFLEISDEEYEKNKKKKVAIIGGGPAGLSCAVFLKRSGFRVTIYEKYSELGGILRRGIPEFRLDRDILDKTIQKILDLGINVEYGKELGQNLSLEELKNEYDAIFLGIGANISRKMLIEGEEFEGVYGGNLLLELGNHPDYTNKNVAIIGGGNVAMDCARTIKKLGAKEVTIIYRRAEEQMPAEKKEIEAAKKEGIKFLLKNNIVKIIGNGKVEKIECIKNNLVKKEGELREIPVDIEGSNYTIDMDYVVMAIGSKISKEVFDNTDIEITDKKYIKIDENYQTSSNKIFAGGDLVGQTATVAWAARSGRDAAGRIREYLTHEEAGKLH